MGQSGMTQYRRSYDLRVDIAQSALRNTAWSYDPVPA
jgi:hypothetical protein